MSGVMDRLRKYFKMEERGTTFLIEFRAGTATFTTLCYILAVNARLLAESGGPCNEKYDNIFSADYETCLEDFRRQLITITAFSSLIGCVLMGIFANLPFALAPGMGMNAYFTYDVVGWRGGGDVPWKMAMTAIFIEGLIFIFLACTGLRIKFAKLIPKPVHLATTGGIGMFLAHLGLQTAEGIGVVVSDIATAVTLGGCAADKRSYATYDCVDENGAFNPFFVTSDSYTCDNDDGKMGSPTMWLGIFCFVFTAILLKQGIKSSIIIGVLLTSIISWFKNTSVSYFDDDVYPLGGSFEYGGSAGGDYRWDYFKKVVHVETIETWFPFVGFGEGGSALAIALITFLYVDLLDTTGTLYAMSKFAGLQDEEGNFEGQTQAFIVDGVATSIGACMGTSPVTTYIESAPGIEAGGRTGVTAIVVGCYFGISIFFAPILASIPPWATGPALILVGAMMMRGLVDIDWDDYGSAIPAFLTIILMPLTYSIAYGMIAGIGSWIIIYVSDVCITACVNQVTGASSSKKEGTPPSENTPEEEENIQLEVVATTTGGDPL
eukprot:CAMPEP_0185745944 /NCGR_PEP_ID=MMETSP1174-20130828/4331_1 /TAXON_ID=35687 /ORGANISM="Dictyocha speculum, Strain CCMP1381" /LENGTH=549 /DNA_ID=CAMNT_0028420245 /DNA_START=24 /DNA_END=1673 /DNA_ORIENTATION=-